MVGSVPCVGGTCFIASSTQIIVIADQAFEAEASEVSLDARITANACNNYDEHTDFQNKVLL